MGAAEVALVLAAALAATYAVAALAARLPDDEAGFEQALLAPPRTDRWPAELIRLERVVDWSAEDGADVHARLRPVLVEIAEARLARRGLRLDRDAAEAERLLGPAWEVVRPGRPAPPAGARGIGGEELDRILDALEGV